MVLRKRKKMSSEYIMYRTRLSTFALSGPFVYRLGRKIFILERGVRFPYGLQAINKDISETLTNPSEI